MWIDNDTCYTALEAHDARFDGRFFVGVSSTGIYCRPVCTVRRPKRIMSGPRSSQALSS
ncbi:MAG: Ada metal-binding domain-containing protein, partial [Ktedonobacteraceae bacterium]